MNQTARLIFLLAILVAQPMRAQSAAGSLDTSFNPAAPDVAPQLVALQRSGKILIAGEFTRVNDTPRIRVARLNPDGSLDGSFDAGAGPDNSLNAIVAQPNGKVLIGGPFTRVNGVPRASLARLNADGSLDETFQQAPLPARNVYALALQPDGRVLVAGQFADLDGAEHPCVVRLNADGSLDAGFGGNMGVSGITTNGSVTILALQPDGKILLGGFFGSVNGVSSANGKPVFVLARVTPDGRLDASFAPLPAREPLAVALQPDGKVLYERTRTGFVPGVDFLLSRFNADGGLDTTYADGDEIRVATETGLRSLIVQPDGKLLLGGGNVPAGNGTTVNGIVRFDGNGNFDPSFTPTVLFDPRTAALQPDGKLVVVGGFASVNKVARLGIARLNNDAGAVSSFFTGAVPVGGGFDYLAFSSGVPFGYYYAGFAPYLYHNDLDFEFILDAGNGRRGVYLYDFKLGAFLYTEPTLWPYLYNFNAQAFFYYFPDPNRSDHFTTNPRVFYNFGNGQFVFSP